MTSSIKHTMSRAALTRRIALAVTIFIAVAGTGAAARAQLANEFVHKELPAFLGRSSAVAGCVYRSAGLTAIGNGTWGGISLGLTAASRGCTEQTEHNSISGISKIWLVKEGQVCYSETLSTNGWQQHEFYWWKTFDEAPCGHGWYTVIACSERISYLTTDIDLGPMIGKTVDDCSHWATWSYSEQVLW